MFAALTDEEFETWANNRLLTAVDAYRTALFDPDESMEEMQQAYVDVISTVANETVEAIRKAIWIKYPHVFLDDDKEHNDAIMANHVLDVMSGLVMHARDMGASPNLVNDVIELAHESWKSAQN